MVLLTITAAIIEALKISSDLKRNRHELCDNQNINYNLDSANDSSLLDCEDEFHSDGHEAHKYNVKQESRHMTCEQNFSVLHLTEPKVGDPISHKQVIELSKLLKSHNYESYRLENMVRGSRLYVPPHPPVAEKTPEFKSLMTRLRQEEEMRSYQQITGPKFPSETISQRFPVASAACAFSSNYPLPSNELDDGVMYEDIRRQITLIFNVFISIIACGSAIWVVGKWWSTPMRLALSMSGSILVGLAEVFIFWGYIRRVGEAKAKEQGIKEVKEVLKTWVIQPHECLDPTVDSHESTTVISKKTIQDKTIRRRK
ncbi:putative vacuolar h+-atpase assembly protein [Erysiphe neolycopersici]|uniref:Putative vacuolar h+-atpase assembly protein n=1 Tax=Erysiphe neolycopersici TaxID=212602 RepID=A0A420HP84_9PEZI|nr:putative vacuolar h+-atpase assembly protein [Erysiphe neolycopersici]